MHSIKTIDGDISIEKGNTYEVDDLEDLRQCLLAIYSTRRGEFSLDTTLGIDYNLLLDKEVSLEEKELEIREVAFQDDRVTSVEDVTIEINNLTRQTEIGVTVMSKAGSVTIEGVQYG